VCAGEGGRQSNSYTAHTQLRCNELQANEGCGRIDKEAVPSPRLKKA